MGFEGTVRHPPSLNFLLFFGPFLHAVPLRLGLAEGAPALAARPWQVFLVGFEGTVRHPLSVSVRSLFRRFFHAVPLRPRRPGWLRPGRALAALVLAAGLWLVGFEGTVRHPASLNFRLFFGPFLHAVPLRLGLAEGALALAARPWRVFLVGFEGTVRHPVSLNFQIFFGPFLHAVPLHLGLAEGALALAARPWRVFLVGFEGTVRHPPSVLLCLLPGFGCEALASLLSGFRRYR